MQLDWLIIEASAGVLGMLTLASRLHFLRELKEQGLLRPVLSRYLEADLAPDLKSDLRTKTDEIGLKSVSFAVVDRTIPTFCRFELSINNNSILKTH